MRRSHGELLATLTQRVSDLSDHMEGVVHAMDRASRQNAEETRALRGDISRLERQMTESRADAQERFATKGALDRVEEARAREINHVGETLAAQISNLEAKIDDRFGRVYDRLDRVEDEQLRDTGARSARRGIWAAVLGVGALSSTLAVLVESFIAR